MTDRRDVSLKKLESRLRGRTSLTETPFTAGGKTFRITHPASADALFDEAEFDRDERIPYWADLWPSALALARYLCALDLSGRRAIELGCGVGLPGVVALDRGADVLATDHYEVALDFAAYNAARATAGINAAGEFTTSLLDWRDPPKGSDTFDLVLAADVLYERSNVPLMVELVPRLLACGGEMLLADPRRPGGKLFTDEMERRGFRVFSKELVVEQDDRKVRVSLHRLVEG